MKSVLTIAGSDCSGGAGIQADIKTICAHNLYAQSVICALSAQNTKKVAGILKVEPEFVNMQLDSVFSDIYPSSIKIGMLFDSKVIESVALKLKQHQVLNVVLDPVMVSTTKAKLITDEAIKNLKNLFKYVNLITPNISEAEVLANIKIKNQEDVLKAINIINKYYKGAILIKGGHLSKSATDFLFWKNQIFYLNGEYIESKNTHGTGCTLSSAIACNLALGYDMLQSCKNAKKYVNEALKNDLNLGKGNGPLNHMYKLKQNKKV